MPDKELAVTTMQFIVQVGVVGAIALFLAVGVMGITYKLGVRLVDGLLLRLDHVELRTKAIEDGQTKIIQEHVAHTLLMKQLTDSQSQIADKLSDICHAPNRR